MENEEQLLVAYKSLWNGRSSVQEIDSLETLCKAIQSELKDEYSHPRVRQHPTDKIEIAFERINRSSLSSSKREKLKSLYIEQLHRIIEVVNPNLDEI